MAEEKNNESGMKRLEEALHNKSPLPQLRTYQGDMAEFIKEKNESVISVAVKEKVREEKREEKREQAQKTTPVIKIKKEGFHISLTILLSSLLLLAGGGMAIFYIFEVVKNPLENTPIVSNEIIPYDKIITLANTTGETLGPEIAKVDIQNGINIIKISDGGGTLLGTVKNFFGFLKISPPAALMRNLGDTYALGAISKNDERATFVVITTNDFGTAFSAMLDWEGTMASDLSFLSSPPGSQTSTTTAQAPTTFTWKDAIVKNKDVRALMNSKYQAKIAYTFLDKNTILITNNVYAIGDISDAYASRSFTR